MAEARLRSGAWQIHVSYSFDRLLESKLAQAYDILHGTLLKILCIIGVDSRNICVSGMDVNAAPLNRSPSTAAAPDVTRKVSGPLLPAY